MALRGRRVVSLTQLFCTLLILGAMLTLYFNDRELHARILTIESLQARSPAALMRQDDLPTAIVQRLSFEHRLVPTQSRFSEQTGEEFASNSNEILPQTKSRDKEVPDRRKKTNEKVFLKEDHQDKSEKKYWEHNVDKKGDNQGGTQEAEATVKELLSRPILNEFNVHYIYTNDKLCSEADMEVLFVIPSAPNNTDRRIWVRNGTQVTYAKDVAHKARAVFFIGLPQKRSNSYEKTPGQSALEQEAKQYGDIVLVDFEDSYKNILVKHLAMLKWALSFCSQTKFVIRTDDDVLVDPVKLITVVRRYQLSHENFILGHRRVNGTPYRDVRKKKTYVSREDYPFDVYPPFVLGGCIGYPLTTVRLLYEAAQRIKTIWLDDVFLTGICAQKLHIQNFGDWKFRFRHIRWKN